MRPSLSGFLTPRSPAPLVTASSQGSSTMNLPPAAALQSAAPTYSPFADWLAKFHTASEPIQALWIVALAAVALGVCWCLAAPLRLWLAARGEPAAHRGELVYGIYRGPDGRLFVYLDGRALALE